MSRKVAFGEARGMKATSKSRTETELRALRDPHSHELGAVGHAKLTRLSGIGRREPVPLDTNI